MDLYFDSLNYDAFLSCVVGGIQRAEQRFRDRLNTVDEHGNLIEDPLIQIPTPNETSET